MASVNMFRGGTPDFKGFFCDGQYPEYMPPFDAPHIAYTPPFDSHAEAALGQGYLNLAFPLVPYLDNTDAHKWMQNALKKVSTQNDIIRLSVVPLRSYIDSLYVELTHFDKLLDGVYVKPVAERVSWNFTTKEWEYKINAEFNTAINNYANNTQIGLGTPAGGDKPYIMARFPQEGNLPPATFGHNIVTRNAQGVPTGGLDEYYGAVVLGLQIIDGSDDAIANLWRADIAMWMTAKLLAFESPTQIG